MKCPHCKKTIPRKQLAKAFASLGGSANTEAQQKARAANAKLGGRPKGSKNKPKK